jgi:hypothetical protein
VASARTSRRPRLPTHVSLATPARKHVGLARASGDCLPFLAFDTVERQQKSGQRDATH